MERDGEPRAVILSVTVYKALKNGGLPDEWLDRVRASRNAAAEDLKGRELPGIEETLADLRVARGEQLQESIAGNRTGDPEGRSR